MRKICLTGLAALGLILSAAQSSLAADPWGLKEGAVTLTSAGPMVFGPNGILFIGDPKAAAVVAIATDDEAGDPTQATFDLPNANMKLAEELGADPSKFRIADLAINPASGNAYLNVAVGEPAQPVLMRIDTKGAITVFPLTNVRHSRVDLAGAPASAQGRRGDPRDDSITDLTFAEGKLYISGLTSNEASSTVRELFFPFADKEKGTNVEIYHAAHGRVEDDAVVRAFAPLMIDGEPVLLAGFTCTPLVKFPLNDIASGEKVRGTTVAELGNQNRPLDMIVYEQDGKTFVLMSNSARGVMKISTEKLQENAGLDEPVPDGNTAGQPFETIAELKGVEQLDKLDAKRAVVLIKTDAGVDLQTIDLP
ncbi:MAG: hypothetical protein SGJ19_17115 [Planctomycetia bacterium]|nr:hypothetical protein [Planctomycetia bacterium]